MPTITGTTTGYLEINSVPLATPAWRTLSLADLYDDPDERGGNRTVPGLDGEIPYRRRIAGRLMTFPLVIVGFWDLNGAAHANPRQGLITNRDYLMSNLGAFASGDGTVNGIWHMPSGATKTADVQVRGLTGARYTGPCVLTTLLTLRVPGGRFT